MRNFRLTIIIDEDPQPTSNSLIADGRRSKSSPKLQDICAMAELMRIFVGVQSLEFSWLDSGRTISWAQGDSFAGTFEGDELTTDCRINDVRTRG